MLLLTRRGACIAPIASTTIFARYACWPSTPRVCKKNPPSGNRCTFSTRSYVRTVNPNEIETYQRVITAAGIHIYAWEPDGSVRKGFPVSSNLGFCGRSLERHVCAVATLPLQACLEARARGVGLRAPR